MSVRVLRNYPLQYFNSLKPKKFSDVFISTACTIGKYNREDGLTKARAVLCILLNDFIDNFNVGQSMSPLQVAKSADRILEKYGMLKIDDLKLCFDMVISGHFGAVYRLDVNVVVDWIDKYINERLNEADLNSYDSHQNIKSNEKREASLMEIIQKHKIK